MTIHSTRSTCSTRRATALVLAAMLTLSAPVAHAADPDVPTDSIAGWQKMYAYARCAFEVFRAVSPIDWAAAMFDCTGMFLAEPPSPADQP